MGMLENKVAIVTGAKQGIGRGIAEAYAKEGAKVALLDDKAEGVIKAGEEVDKVSSGSFGVRCDVGNRDEVDAVVQDIADKLGGIDILVNCAQGWAPPETGITSARQTPLQEYPEEHWDYIFQSGVKATLYTCQAVYPYMKERGAGRIINFGSYWGMMGWEGTVAYNSNKEAIRGLSRTAAREWGPDNINVNVICPAASTPSVQDFERTMPEAYEEVRNSIPLRRFGDPEKDIGAAAVFLASELSAYVTGLTLMADGGLLMVP